MVRVLFFSIHKVVRPADSDKIANLARHPKSLGTAALQQPTITQRPPSTTPIKQMKYSCVAYIKYLLATPLETVHHTSGVATPGLKSTVLKVLTPK